MTDKVQKIKEWISKEQDGLMDAQGNFEYPEHEGAYHILCNLDTYIDSLQEESIAPKVLEDMLNAKTAAESLGISQEEHDRIVDELIYRKKPELVDVDDLPNKEEEPVSEELHIVIDNEVKKIWDEINTGHDYCIIDSYNQFYGICIQIAECAKKEPVSEDLEESAETYTNRRENEKFEVGEGYDMDDVENAFKAGAQWQKEVFEKNRLAACDRATKEEIEREQDFVDKVLIGEQRQPTFSDAIEYGIKWQKQQTIEKACNFLVDAGKYMKYNPIDDEYKFNAQQLVKDFRKYMEE